MSYKTEFNQETNMYNILETNSGVIIQVNKTQPELKTLCRKLNLGSGFNGWTPLFFSNQYKLHA
jgi:hypothetical protein